MVVKKTVANIFINYTVQIKQYISRIVHPDDIDDIVQETFVRSYEAELKHEIKYARSFMLKTARNLALNHVNKWDNKFKDPIEDITVPTVHLTTQDFEQEFESKERFLQFCRATEKLTGNVRKSFILKKVYGFSQKEIAEYLKLSESTVEKHVAKGLLQCVQFMELIESSENSNNITELSKSQQKVQK